MIYTNPHFEKIFGEKATYVFSAPGRTELSGNHTDHQHGCVLAAAVNLEMMAWVRKTDTDIIRVLSEGYPMSIIDVSDLEIKYPDLFEIYKTEFYNFTSPGGESYDEFYARAWSATKRLLQNHNGKTVVVTSHGGTIRAIFTRLLHNDKTMLSKVSRSLNTAVYEVDFYDDGSFEVITENDASHLDKKVKVGLEM